MLKELVDRITAEGKHLGSGILKVDGFMNHQIDPVLMKHIGEEFARRFASVEATRILTAEASGIAPALAAGMVMNLPIVFAKKKRPVTMPAGETLKESAPSHTKGEVVDLLVSGEYLNESDRVLIIDDFLSTARTLNALIRLVNNRGAKLVGIGAVIEKSFQGGRGALTDVDVPVESLAVITRFEGDEIIFL